MALRTSPRGRVRSATGECSGIPVAHGFSKPTNGGLNLGDGLVAAIELVIFIGLVAYVARAKLDVQPARVHSHRRPQPIPTLATEPE
jgi:hypothetical protein